MQQPPVRQPECNGSAAAISHAAITELALSLERRGASEYCCDLSTAVIVAVMETMGPAFTANSFCDTMTPRGNLAGHVAFAFLSASISIL